MRLLAQESRSGKDMTVGREKPNKPRKSRGETPRIIDMQNVSPEAKKNALLSFIMEGEGPVWRMLQQAMRQKYGEFTIEERDLLDLPAQTRTDAMNDLAFYATAQLPAQAPMGAREAAARTAANCRQALARLAPLVEKLG